MSILANILLNDSITIFVIAIAVFIILFLALREVNCWYWKINERIGLQKETNSLLQKMLLSNAQPPERVIIKNTKTGDGKIVSYEEWLEIKRSDKNGDYQIVPN